MISKKILIPAVALAIVGGGFFSYGTLVFAQSGTTPFGNLAQALATKFNLNQTDVQSFLSTFRQQGMQNMEQKRFDKLVTDGKITSAQETAILAELATVRGQNTPDSLKNMTPADRQAAFQKQKDTLTAWANSQGINPMYVMPFGMGGMGKGGMHRGGPGMWHKNPTTTPTPTP